MTWFQYFLAVYFLLTAALTVANVGKVQKPTTPEVAAVTVILNAFLISSVFLFGGRS